MQYIDTLITRYPDLNPIKQDIERAFEAISDAFTRGHKLITAGNGGSAADAEHIVGELMKSFVKTRKLQNSFKEDLKEVDEEIGKLLSEKLQWTLPAIALTDNVPLATAIANDIDPDLMFAQQLIGYGKRGDIFLMISTSGNAKNLINAAVTAKAIGLKTVLLGGQDGGKLKKYADYSIIVPETETYRIQERHVPIYHTLCLELENYFF